MAAAVAGRPRPAAPPGLAELLDSDDERMRLEPAKAILDPHLGRPEVRLMRRSIDFEYIGTRAGHSSTDWVNANLSWLSISIAQRALLPIAAPNAKRPRRYSG